MASFAEAVGAWASATERRLSAVHKKAIEKLAMEMTRTRAEGGNVPVDTGNLYRSLLASTTGMPKTAEGPFAGSNVPSVIATLRMNDPVWLGYQAKYARRVNFGFVGADALGRVYNQQGAHFVERAIAMWSQIVREAVEEVKNASR
nr:MAG: hypothetical protein DIU57_19345 [Pseudomonadota bacterium]